MKVKKNEEIEVTVKTVRINAKCSDLCITELIDEKGSSIVECDGYVPGFMPGDHYGDYIILDIDMETGKILNWTPSKHDVQEFIDSEGE